MNIIQAKRQAQVVANTFEANRYIFQVSDGVFDFSRVQSEKTILIVTPQN